jgi:hypothetical protein
MKYSPPAPTHMLVAIAEALRAAMQVIELASRAMTKVYPRPTLPTTHPKRKYITRLRMIRKLGT